MVGSLMYAMISTRPDLAVAVSVVSKYLDNYTATHCELVSHIYRYIRANLNLKLHYQTHGSVKLEAYTDASWANDINYKSRLGYGCLIGNSLVSWYSGYQKGAPAQSSAEAEYYAAVAAANEVLWFRTLLGELGFPQETTTIHEDNQACIALTKNPEDHKRTKHIQVKYHVIREYVAEKLVKFIYCPTKFQYGDMFTKPLNGNMLRSNLKHLGIIRQGENQESTN